MCLNGLVKGTTTDLLSKKKKKLSREMKKIGDTGNAGKTGIRAQQQVLIKAK